MEEQKYYLDEQGVIQLLRGISQSIREKKTTSIQITNVEDPDTGEVTKEIVDPDNFATVEAVVKFTDSRHNKLVINQPIVDVLSEEDYRVVDNNVEYNGDEAISMKFDLIPASDIRNLFN